jgi:hypothetical protein
MSIKHIALFKACFIKLHGFKSDEQASHRASIITDSPTISANGYSEQAPWTLSTFCTKSQYIFYLRSLDRKRVSKSSRRSEFIVSKTVISFLILRAASAPSFPGLTTYKGTSFNCTRIFFWSLYWSACSRTRLVQTTPHHNKTNVLVQKDNCKSRFLK